MNCCPSPTNHELGDIEQVASNRVVSYSCFARFFDPFRSFVASTRAFFETFSRPGGFEASRVEHSRRQEASSRGFRAFSKLGGVEASPEASILRGFSRPGGFEARHVEHVRRPDASQRASGASRARVRDSAELSCNSSRGKSKVYVWCLRSE